MIKLLLVFLLTFVLLYFGIKTFISFSNKEKKVLLVRAFYVIIVLLITVLLLLSIVFLF